MVLEYISDVRASTMHAHSPFLTTLPDSGPAHVCMYVCLVYVRVHLCAGMYAQTQAYVRMRKRQGKDRQIDRTEEGRMYDMKAKEGTEKGIHTYIQSAERASAGVHPCYTCDWQRRICRQPCSCVAHAQ